MGLLKKDAGVSKEVAFANAPLLPLMLSLGIPTFIAQLINLLYNIVDRIYIGHIPDTGAMALTGVGVCLPIIMLVSAFACLAGFGGAPLAGIALGAGDKKEAEKILGNSASALISMAVVLMVVFQLVKKPFLYAFGASDVTYQYGGPYLQIYLFGTVFVMISLGLNMYIMIQGEAVVAMASILIGAVCNLVLDPIFIFALHMGVRGAAIATVLSQTASAVWILRFLTGKDRILRLTLANMHFDKGILLKIAALGVSPFIMNGTESLINIVFNRGAQMYGNDLYVGSITILQSIMQVLFVPLSGFNQGVQPIISFNYGAKNMERVKKTCFLLIGITGSFSFLLAGIFMLFPGQVAGMFTNDPQLIAICREKLPIFMAGMLIFGLQNGSQSSFMALGRAKESLFFALLRKVFLLTPLALILPMMMQSVDGIYLAEPISDAVSAICCFTMFMITLKRLCNENR